MCRVIITSRRDFLKYDEEHGVLALMDHLEHQCGGHGNGYALLKKGKIVGYAKGQKLQAMESYLDMYHGEWDYAIWHTRIASVGDRSDSNCHPYIDESGQSAMAMNGTEYGFSTIANGLGVTDTEIIFRILKGYAPLPTVTALKTLRSVFVGFAAGEPYVVRAEGELCRWGDSSFHASTFPHRFKEWVSLGRGYAWLSGKVVDEGAMEKAYIYPYGDSYNYRDNYLYDSASTKSKGKTKEEQRGELRDAALYESEGWEYRYPSDRYVDSMPAVDIAGESADYERGYMDGWQDAVEEYCAYDDHDSSGDLAQLATEGKGV